jgi:hypothetical protein
MECETKSKEDEITKGIINTNPKLVALVYECCWQLKDAHCMCICVEIMFPVVD